MPLAEAKCRGLRQSSWAVGWRASHFSLCCQGLQGWGRKGREQTWLKGTGGAPEATPHKLVKEECGENGSLLVLQCSGAVLSLPLYCCHLPPPFDCQEHVMHFCTHSRVKSRLSVVCGFCSYTEFPWHNRHELCYHCPTTMEPERQAGPLSCTLFHWQDSKSWNPFSEVAQHINWLCV